MSKPVKIVICIPTMHERTGWVSKQLSQWLTDMPFADSTKYQVAITYAHNFMPAASARNFFCRTYKTADPRPDWLLMIDNDMVPPENLLSTIDNAPADASVVVPQFQMWDEGKGIVALCWGMEDVPKRADGGQSFTIEPGRWYPLSKCGTGAIFIKPEVFDKLELPYFEYPYNKDHGIEGTEDINFCQKVLAAGMKIYGNGSVRVGHYKSVNLDILVRYVENVREQTRRDVLASVGMAVDSNGNLVVSKAESPSDSSVATACPA